MYEVHSGIKPGRPTTAVVICAGVLVATLGIAALQVRDKLALGEPMRLGGTALSVRLPRGWDEDPDRPWSFVMKARRGRGPGERPTIERRITFETGRWHTFLSPGTWLDGALPRPNRFDVRARVVSSTRIGPLFGQEAIHAVQRRFGRWSYVQEYSTRVVVSPRGDYIAVNYEPLSEMTPGERQLLDDICDNIRLDEPALHMSHEEVLEAAGLKFSVQRDWQLCGPDFPEAPGLYIAQLSEGHPIWAIGVFRTWLAPDRQVGDLLRDFGREVWGLSDRDITIQRASRDDGRVIAGVRHPRADTGSPDITSVWATAAGESEAAILFVSAPAERIETAAEACAQLASQLEFTAPYPRQWSLRTAVEAGGALAERLRTDGPEPAWAEQRSDEFYVCTMSVPRSRKTAVYIGRGPQSAGAAGGYAGRMVYYTDQHDSGFAWSLDRDLRGHAYRFEGLRGLLNDIPVSVTETRDGSSAMLRREITTARRRGGSAQTIVYEVPIRTGFVCLPLLDVAERWTATQSGGQLRIIAASSLFGDKLHTQLMRRLPADAEGRARVMIQKDYYPRGDIVAYGGDGETAYQVAPDRRYERSTLQEVAKIYKRAAKNLR